MHQDHLLSNLLHNLSRSMLQQNPLLSIYCRLLKKPQKTNMQVAHCLISNSFPDLSKYKLDPDTHFPILRLSTSFHPPRRQ